MTDSEYFMVYGMEDWRFVLFYKVRTRNRRRVRQKNHNQNAEAEAGPRRRSTVYLLELPYRSQ